MPEHMHPMTELKDIAPKGSPNDMRYLATT